MIMAGLGVLVVAVAGYWWFTATRGANETERTLRRTCMTDAQAARLIDYESERAPGISRQEAARRAVERRRRDNS
jgi:hypothetical protein